MKKLTFLAIIAIFSSMLTNMAAETFTRVTEEPESWDGEYIIYDEVSQYIWNGNLEGGSLLSLGNSHKADGMVTTDGKLDWKIQDCYFKITSLPDGGYSIRSCSNYFIGGDDLSKSKSASATTVYANDINFSNGYVNITSRNTSDKFYFICYKYDGLFSVITEKDLAKEEKRWVITKDLVLLRRDNQSNKVSTPYCNYDNYSTVLCGNTLTIDSDPGTYIMYEGLKTVKYETNHVEITIPEEETTLYFKMWAIDPTGKKEDSEKITMQLRVKNSSVDNIQAIISARDTTNPKRFNNPVTVVHQNESNSIYIKDETGSLVMLGKIGLTGLKNGDILNAGFSARFEENGTYYYLTDVQNLVKSETPGAPVIPIEIKIADVKNYNIYEYVTLKAVKYNNGYFYDRRDNKKIVLSEISEVPVSEFENDKVYNVIGFIDMNTSINREFIPISKEEVQVVEEVSISPDFGEISKGTEITITCPTEGAVLNGTINDNTLVNETLPYSFIADNDGEMSINVWASKEGCADSNILNGTYTVYTQQVEPLSITPEFGKIIIGTEITISCLTENAVLNGTINGKTIENAAIPYSFTAESTGDWNINVWASKEYCTNSTVLEGTFNVCLPKIAPVSISPDFGDIEKGTEITISYPEGTILNGTINDETIENAPNPYILKAEDMKDIHVNVWASKENWENSDIITGTFSVVKYAYKDIISHSDKDFNNGRVQIVFNDINRNGASYILGVDVKKNDENECQYLAFDVRSKNEEGIVMKKSAAAVSKIVITWDKSSTSNAGFEIYGKNTPYKSVERLYYEDEASTGTLITKVEYNENESTSTITLGEQYTFIGLKPFSDQSTNIKSIEFIWNEGTQGGQDTKYTKVTSKSKLKNGYFAVLATQYGDAVKREEVFGGHINSVEVNYATDGGILLEKGQLDVEEFEIISIGNDKYYLRGGLEADNSRRYLAAIQYSGLRTITKPDETAVVTFEKKTDGFAVKFHNGEYLMYYDNKFVLGSYTEQSTLSDEDIVLIPAYVYISESNISTGVENVTINADDSDTMYFNLNGVQVNAENLTPGLYIVRQGNKVTKQIIK